jgi:hypothetical protein
VVKSYLTITCHVIIARLRCIPPTYSRLLRWIWFETHAAGGYIQNVSGTAQLLVDGISVSTIVLETVKDYQKTQSFCVSFCASSNFSNTSFSLTYELATAVFKNSFRVSFTALGVHLALSYIKRVIVGAVLIK